jgi:hypothetical protein
MVAELMPQAKLSGRSAIIRHRLSIRYPPNSNTTARIFAHVGDEGWPATIQNISLAGISLSLEHWIDPKSTVVLELRNDERDFSRLLQLRVLRVRDSQGGTVTAAGTLNPQLSHEELHLLR